MKLESFRVQWRSFMSLSTSAEGVSLGLKDKIMCLTNWRRSEWPANNAHTHTEDRPRLALPRKCRKPGHNIWNLNSLKTISKSISKFSQRANNRKHSKWTCKRQADEKYRESRKCRYKRSVQSNLNPVPLLCLIWRYYDLYVKHKDDI